MGRTAKDNTVYASLEKRDMPSISFLEEGCKKTDANLNQVRKAWAKRGLDMSASSLLPKFTKVTSMKKRPTKIYESCTVRQCSSVRKASLECNCATSFLGSAPGLSSLVSCVCFPPRPWLLDQNRAIVGGRFGWSQLGHGQTTCPKSCSGLQKRVEISRIFSCRVNSSEPFFGICESDRLNGIEVASVWVLNNINSVLSPSSDLFSTDASISN